MASLILSSVGQGLSAFSSGISDIFTNVKDVVQSVDSVYDQLTGKSESVPSQVATPTITPAVPAPGPAAKPQFQLSGTTIAIGAVVLLGVILIVRN